MRDVASTILLAAVCWLLGWVSRPSWRWQLDECRAAQTACAYQLTVDAVLYRECAGIAGIKHEIGAWYLSALRGQIKTRVAGKPVAPGAAVGPVGSYGRTRPSP